MDEKQFLHLAALAAVFAIGFHLGAKRAAATKAAAATPDQAEYWMTGFANWGA